MTLIDSIQSKRPTKQETATLVAAMVGGCIHQMLFYGKDWGVSYPLFVLLFYVYFYWAVRERHELRFGAELLFLVPIALLSLTYAAFSNGLFMVLNALAVPCLIVAHTTWTIRKKELNWFDSAMVPAVLDQVFVHSLRYVPLPVQTVVRAISGRMKSGRSRQLWKVLAGIVISLPILLLVGSLLASADAIFEKTVSKLPQWLGELQFGWFFFRLIWISVIGTGMFIYVWGLLYPKQRSNHRSYWDEKADFERRFGVKGTGLQGVDPALANDTTGMGTPVAITHAAMPPAVWNPARLDPTIMTTVLLMLNAVYVLFAVVQFSYFFGSGAGLLPDGVTYAEYARRGFAELVIVTIINFTVLMVILYGVDRSSRPDHESKLSPPGAPAAGSAQLDFSASPPSSLLSRVLTVLLTMLVGCTGIMLCSAYLRLSLYEMAYGYTITRVLVHAFMIFLLLLFIAALFKLWRGKLQLMKLYLIISIVAYVLLNYVQVDAIIAANNVERYEQTGQMDVAYLQSLSFEAVPYLIELQQRHPEVEGTQQALQRMKHRLELQENSSWTEFNVSEWRAAKKLQSVAVQEEPLRR